MALNLPIDDNGREIPITPSKAAIATTVDSTISTATTITLNSLTRFIEVSALAQGIFLRYTTGASSTDFDEYIQANTTRHYVIPAGVTQISVIQQAATATVIVIEK